MVMDQGGVFGFIRITTRLREEYGQVVLDKHLLVIKSFFKRNPGAKGGEHPDMLERALPD